MVNAYTQYQNNSVMTASPAELTLMLYNGAIKFCNQAVEAIEKKDLPGSHTFLIKAQNIIVELRATLDTKYPIAIEMDNLYEFIYRTLVEANMTKDIAKINDARDLIRDFRDTWQEVIKQRKRA